MAALASAPLSSRNECTVSTWIPQPIPSRTSDPPLGDFMGTLPRWGPPSPNQSQPIPHRSSRHTSRPCIPALVQQPHTSPPWAELSLPSAMALGTLPRCPSKAELQGTSPSTASHSRVASAYSPRDVTELSMHTKGTLDRELFMEGGHQSHADP